MKCSVVILTYRSDIEKVLMTVESVIQQKGIDFELIISDDGSDADHYDIIEQYLTDKKFKNYYFVHNEKNVGTVKNLYRAMKYCKGEYVKGIGAGDLLFSDKTLAQMCRVMEEKQGSIGFGLMKKFAWKENRLIQEDYIGPGNIDAYLLEDEKAIRENIIVFGKFISGAGMIYHKDEVMFLLEQMIDKVIYCEDYMQVLALLHNMKICFVNHIVTWYEWGEGISSSGEGILSPRMRNDRDSFYQILRDRYNDGDPYIKRCLRKLSFNKISNRYIRGIVKAVSEPKLFLVERKTEKQKQSGKYTPDERGFLDDPAFQTYFINAENHTGGYHAGN